ncbi:hypothetical protein D5018_15670 [Parashewanella curva]|uniref:DUF2490 domain-containing protein n=1 Tax=Parashewanella curva TaxID=2338552 RepID=A0A3L8PTV3_9GAMM|nr:hypothetical protein [Parashewanella curva]RLV58736.1 hypothetical protein D5018_15670 [Parashewanella curva]
MKKLTKIFTVVALLSASQATMAGSSKAFKEQEIGKAVNCNVEKDCQPLEQIMFKIRFIPQTGFNISKTSLEMTFSGKHAEFGAYTLKFGEQSPYLPKKDQVWFPQENIMFYKFPIVAEFSNGNYEFNDSDYRANLGSKFFQADSIRKSFMNKIFENPIIIRELRGLDIRASKTQKETSLVFDIRQVPSKFNSAKLSWEGYLQQRYNNQAGFTFDVHKLIITKSMKFGMAYRFDPNVPFNHNYTDTIYGHKRDSEGVRYFAEFLQKSTDFGDFLSFMHSKI